MAVFDHLRLVFLAVLMLASQLDFASAVRLFAIHARDLHGDAAGNPPDPFVKVFCAGIFGGQTEYHKDNANPSWSAVFNFPDCLPNDNLKLEVWDKDLNFDDHLGTCSTKVQYGTNSITCHLSRGVLYYKYELVQ
ncbi:C2 domain-containing At1g53590-like protein [Labeo rohita]|uniref:C2 domain-containing At1g53590-like protein n=1 Tax=Labeo rohita TaxID=84645 RepID=A0A498MV66_LABRO|nr:perforin-1-like [Labeo rohita]RXN25718.1 C2 domain-containing At1g53590-like protein [Labeo rohita]RXN27481.1 C2 domain-containing At1g53590-like protein [Labeo rohita]